MSPPTKKPVAGTVGVLLVMDVAGAAISLSTGLNPTFLDALGPQALLSAPLPMMAAQAVLAFAVTRDRRAVAIPAAALLVVAGALAFVSGFFDGGYAAELTLGQRAFQIALITGHLALSALAGRHLVRLLRSAA
ncbi:hypothetical protein FDA94_19915 [Herbidospora galbida]|uniref:Uncharacterized protein n=1 Tax=Herbidospora galbida TaxID=2575442 RepID=A0A4U3MDE1_9ACTN|nr:hypothetical protein [Herbidospora galbida]TKK86730.1 hypothetical protein FDA94_19915 [Herbidospora galbida]